MAEQNYSPHYHYHWQAVEDFAGLEVAPADCSATVAVAEVVEQVVVATDSRLSTTSLDEHNNPPP